MSQKVQQINRVIEEYFKKNISVGRIPAKDLMPYFVEAGIFAKDHKNGLPIRKLLRSLDEENQLKLIPYVLTERKAQNTNWFFQRNKQNSQLSIGKTEKIKPKNSTANKTRDRDEDYILNLCDEVLSQKGLRQHRFDFLRGDAGTKLPVDIYYPELNLVIEYREYQHTNPVKHFDKPDVMTVSNVHRGEKRKIYDQRRRDMLPQENIKLIEISYGDFAYSSSHRIIRNREKDILIVKKLIKDNL